jgi:Zn-dependent protease
MDMIQQALLSLPVLLLGLTIHEFSHGYVAYRFGDPTAKDAGRLTLNPLKHLDLFGVLVFFLSQFRFGWAKPVPVNPYNLRNPRVADFWVSAAGPLSNLGQALIFGLLFRAVSGGGQGVPDAVLYFLFYGVSINLTLAFFNLIPLYPLDGSHMLKSILPAEMAMRLADFDRFAPFVLIILIFMGGLWYILGPFVKPLIKILTGV